MEVKKSTNKCTLVAGAFLHFQILTLSGRTLCAAMSSTREIATFGSWLKQRMTLDLRSPFYFSRVPADSDLLALREGKEVKNV